MKIHFLSLCIILISGSYTLTHFDKNAVVKIVIQPEEEGNYASGFLINKEGHILTIYNPIIQQKPFSIVVPYLNKALDATIVDTYPNLHIALLKLTEPSLHLIQATLGNIPYLELSNASIAHGQQACALGYPLGISNVHSRSMIIAGGNRILDEVPYRTALGSFSMGYGGGPLINTQGKVIGMSVASTQSFTHSVSFIIPISIVKGVVKVSNGKKTKKMIESVKAALKSSNIPSHWQQLPYELQDEALKFFSDTFAILR